jgi:hypothetical protein
MHKSVIGFIGVGVILLLMSMMMTAVKGSTTAPRTDSFSVTTGGGETTAIIGTQELPWKGLTSSVETISSSQPTLDFPLCSFVSGNEVTVSGLDASQTRVLTVTYLYDSNQGSWAPARWPQLYRYCSGWALSAWLSAWGWRYLKKDDQIECLKAWQTEDAMRGRAPFADYSFLAFIYKKF